MMHLAYAQPRNLESQPRPSSRSSFVNDDALLERARAGHVASFEELAKRHAGKVFALIFRMVHGRREVAEDLTQDTFLAAFQSLAQFRGDSQFATWLHRIAVNKTLHFLEKKQLPTSTLSALPEESPLDPPDPQGGPEQILEESELHAHLQASIDRLPASLRVVFLMREVEKLGYDEIAASLETTSEAVRVRLHRAKKELLTLLRPYLQGEASAKNRKRALVKDFHATP